ncbi:hypothetical protein VP01_1193g11 [Puccinia sorghi]|uniref:Uncharacterized protein n=1 Tax=Puccinia sorghi TaxID=27349 RepID=A0A0L6VQQ7_9BASI|nr:hypothetical protein VP01_1193g11 [Puccinia sorghi]
MPKFAGIPLVNFINADRTGGHLKEENYLVKSNGSRLNRITMPALEVGRLILINSTHSMTNTKKVHTKSISTGFGLTNQDQKVGISTINEKLETMCPQYHTMKELIGDQAEYEKEELGESAQWITRHTQQCH